VLLVGLPRSGTTWAGQVLAGAPGLHEVTEPDNEGWSSPAIVAKRGLGRWPVLRRGDAAPAYRRLWTWVLAGAPRSSRLDGADRLLRRLAEPERQRLVDGHPGVTARVAGRLGRPPGAPQPGPQRVLAKSVHAVMALEWLVEEFEVEVVVLLRHPAGIYASWVELDLPDADRGIDRNRAVREQVIDRLRLPSPGPSASERAMWQLGVLLSALDDAVARHPEWLVRTHEELCAQPEDAFRSLSAALGLEWSAQSGDRLRATDQHGTGYSTHRRTAALPGAWQSRLTARQLDELQRVLEGFPLPRWSDEGFGRR
jgi:hypothetical protein